MTPDALLGRTSCRQPEYYEAYCEGIREVCDGRRNMHMTSAIVPGVMAQTGMELEIVKGIKGRRNRLCNRN